MTYVSPWRSFVVACMWLSWLGVAACTPGEARAAPPQVDELAKHLVVAITCELSGQDGSTPEPSTGAGILFGAGPKVLYILTANHVVRPGATCKNVKVRPYWLRDRWVTGQLLPHFDPGMDLAVLSVPIEVPKGGFSWAGLGQVDLLRPGDRVRALGHPNGVWWDISMSADPVSEIANTRIYFQSTVLATGSSGGALLNSSDEVVGMLRSDQPPRGEAVSIAAILARLKTWQYPIQLRAGELPSSLIPLRDEVSVEVTYSCDHLLAQWPGGDLQKQERTFGRLSALVNKVQAASRFADHERVLTAKLLRCTASAHLIFDGDFPDKIEAAMPLLRDSLRLDPSQKGLKEDIRVFQDMLDAHGGKIVLYFTALLHVVRGDDPSNPELAQGLANATENLAFKARLWLLGQATKPSVGEMLDLMRQYIEKENGQQFKVEVTSKQVSDQLVEVRATLGPNVYEWEVNYEAKTYRAKDKATEDLMWLIAKASVQK